MLQRDEKEPIDILINRIRGNRFVSKNSILNREKDKTDAISEAVAIISRPSSGVWTKGVLSKTLGYIDKNKLPDNVCQTLVGALQNVCDRLIALSNDEQWSIVLNHLQSLSRIANTIAITGGLTDLDRKIIKDMKETLEPILDDSVEIERKKIMDGLEAASRSQN